MDNQTQKLFSVADRSYFSIIKKEVRQMAINIGFSTYKVAEIDIIVAELVSNLVKHANGGQLLVKQLVKEGLELIAMDDGPGMQDVNKMLQDGISTKNTAGTGLGAIKRLSDVFQIYSQPTWGTLVLSRLLLDQTITEGTPPIQHSVVIVPKPGETACGDGYYLKADKNRIKIMLGDGLGHGIAAEAAVKEAIGAFHVSSETTSFESLRFIHQQVKKTRGLVATVAIINKKNKTCNICGIGNVLSSIVSPGGSKNYMSYNGIVGLNIPSSMKDQEIELERGQVLIMCSDGIKTRWDINKYPMIFKYDLSILTAALFKDFARKTDDMGIIAVKYNT